MLPASVALAALAVVVVPHAAAEAPPTQDWRIVKVAAPAVAHVGDDVHVRVFYENAGPDLSPVDCELRTAVRHGGPIVFRSAEQADGDDVAGVLCGSSWSDFDAIAVRTGVARLRVTIGPFLNRAVDPNSSNNTAEVSLKIVAARRTFTELRGPVWSPDGRTLAFVRWTEPSVETAYPTPTTMGRIWIARADGSDAHAVTATMPVPRFLSWNPNGRAIAFATEVTERSAVWSVDVLTRHLTALGAGTTPAWSPDGRRIAYLTGDSQGAQIIDTVSSTGGGPTVLLRAYWLGPEPQQFVWSPDGSAIRVGAFLVSTDGLATVTPTNTLEWTPNGSFVLTRDPATRRLTVTDSAGDAVGKAPALLHPHIAPDGAAVAGATVSGKVVVVTVANSAKHSAPHAQSLHDQVSWSRTLVAYVGGGTCGPRSEIDAVRADGSGFRVIARAC